MEDQEEPRNYLGSLGQQIKRHWQEHRPRMYRKLEQNGQLHQALVQAQNQTSDALHSLLRQGVPYDQAWESVREEWAFLPDEDDVRHLAAERDPRNWVVKPPPPAAPPVDVYARPRPESAVDT